MENKTPTPKEPEEIEDIISWAKEEIDWACNCGVCQCEDEIIVAGHECETVKVLRKKLLALLQSRDREWREKIEEVIKYLEGVPTFERGLEDIDQIKELIK